MKNVLLLFCLFSSLSYAQSTKPVSTSALANRVLNKGLNTVDMGAYPGSLLMQSMSELAVNQGGTDLMNQTLDLFALYKQNRIKGRGSAISYEAGGSGAAYLTYLKKSPALTEQVATIAEKMMQKQTRSKDGIMTAGWLKDPNEQVFIDMAFAVTPYLLYSGLALNKPDYVDMAVSQTLDLFKILHDPANGLIHQGRGFTGKGSISEDNWSRGNGWGSLALASLVRDLPDSHPRKAAVNALANQFFTAVLKHQNAEGLWHQEMSDPSTFVETSGSGLLLYGLGIAIEKKIIDKSKLPDFQRGLAGLLAYVGSDGSVGSVCGPCLCPGKGTKADYAQKTGQYNDAHGFGPVVLAFAQALKLGINQVVPTQTPGRFAVPDTTLRKPQTYVRYMPEANGNILWENDRVAFRVYGPPVKDRVSSGIDVWTKSVDYPIIDKWYRLNAAGKEYHEDRGEGCDFFHVGFGRGNGGTAIWHNGKPYISQPYATHRILKNSPEEIEFELTYAPWKVGDDPANRFTVTERKTISMKMGTNLFKVVSTFETDYKGPLTAAIGISFAGVTGHDKPDIISNQQAGTLTIWESYLPKNGELGTTVITNPALVGGFATHQKEQFMLVNVKAGQPITYFVGAGWTKNPHVKSKQDWLAYIQNEIPKLSF
jgi:rhamnogalacturonyl hydrolase YesR